MRSELKQRYWDYQRSQFSDGEKYFERPEAANGRPPVFRVEEASNYERE
jgi:hypothetical protein